MGLLTDPRAGTGKLIKFFLKREKQLCFLLYIGGIICTMILAVPAFNDHTYFSENALLPGLVTKESNLDQTSKQFYYELLNEMKRYPDSMPYAWLSAKFNQLHLDTFIHNFSLIYPFKEQKFTGQNIYGIVRAPKAASTESIVVSVPFRPINSIYLSTAPSVALLLAFAKFCRKQKYWAKDIIFLVTEYEQLGMQAWLDAYHGVTSGQEGILLSGDLPGHAGSIQAAINLELHAMRISSIDVKVEGLNGQLPNLDLFNLAQNMIAKEDIQKTFQRRLDSNDKNTLKKWWYQFNTLMTMVATQATGTPTGNHGLFHRFGIEAVTLEGFEKTGKSSVSFYQVGRVVESMVRSLNNLLERFHQSYFFYLLPSTDRYVSISLYMRPLVLIVASLFIKAFSMWQKLQAPVPQNDDKNNIQVKNTKVKIFDIGSIASEILWAHTFGVCLLLSPQMFTSIGRQMGNNLRTEDSIYIGNAMATILTLLWPLTARREVKYENILLVCVIASVELATTLICVAMCNFSLALLAASVYVPAALFSKPRQGSTSRFRILLYILWILLHPFVASSIVILGYTYVNFSEQPLLSLIFSGYRATKQAFVFSIIDSMIYGNWFYNVTMTVMLPIWLLFWNIICLKSTS